jgi:hypothetical protein
VVQSAAATALGNLKEPDPEVIDALLASIRRTPEAAVAIGKLVDRIALESRAKIRILTKAARALQKIVQQNLPSKHMLHGLGYNGVCEAFGRVVSRITELEVAELPPEDPCAVPGRSQ